MIVLGDLPPHARMLRAIRLQRHWTQRQLATQLSVSIRTLRNWENNRAQPNTRDVSLFRILLAQGMEQTAWAHLAALDNIQRDERSSNLTTREAEALREALHTVRVSLLKMYETTTKRVA